MTGPDDGRHSVQHHLGGLRVLELGSGLDVAFGGKLMADLGASVASVECSTLSGAGSAGAATRPQGAERLRRHLQQHKGVERLSSGDAAAQLQEAWQAADCVIEDLGPSGLEKFDLEVAGRRTGPAAVVRITPWGLDPRFAGRAASTLVLQAAAGWVQHRDHDRPDPVAVGGRYEAYAVGVYAAVAALTGIEHARQSGVPATVDLARMACLHSTLAYPVTATEARDEEPIRGQARQQPFGIMRCRDGWVGVNILTDVQWRAACDLVDLAQYGDRRGELGRDEDLFEGFQRAVAAWLAGRDVEDVVVEFQHARVPAVPVADGALMANNPQFIARGFLDPGTSAVARRGPGLPYVFARPRQGQTSGGDESSTSRDRAEQSSRRPRDVVVDGGQPVGNSPFRGLRVLDLGCFWAGPYATCYLAGFGADVVKIESSRRPDGFRFVSAPQDGAHWYEAAPLWQSTNLGKRSLSLDLTTDEGRSLFLRLVEQSDVVLENYSARVMDRFELTYEHLSAVNPGIIMVRMPGFGLSGPWRDYVGYGIAFEQVAGWAEVTGFPEGPPQTPGGYIDPIVGMHATFAILAALRQRRQTGEGQQVEIAQAEVGASLAAELLLDHAAGEPPPGRMGNRGRGIAPQGVYQTGDRAPTWVAISIHDDTQWQSLVSAMGHPAWTDGLDAATTRWDQQDEIDDELARWAGGQRAQELARLLQEAGVPAARVQAPSEVGADPVLLERGYFRELTHAVSGTRRYAGYPMSFSFSASNPHRHAAPRLGEHSAAVLADLLGLGPDEYRRLVASGVVGEGWQPSS